MVIVLFTYSDCFITNTYLTKQLFKSVFISFIYIIISVIVIIYKTHNENNNKNMNYYNKIILAFFSILLL